MHSPIFIALALLLGALSPLTAKESSPAQDFHQRAQQAVHAALAQSKERGLHLVVIHDDGESALARSITTFPIDAAPTNHSRDYRSETSWLLVHLSTQIDPKSGELVVQGKIDAKVDFAGGRRVRNAQLLPYAIDEHKFDRERLKKSEPCIYSTSLLTNAPGDTEQFSEGSAFALVWN